MYYLSVCVSVCHVSWHVSSCVCVSVCVCIFVRVGACVWVCVYMYICVCVCICLCVCLYGSACVWKGREWDGRGILWEAVGSCVRKTSQRRSFPSWEPAQIFPFLLASETGLCQASQEGRPSWIPCVGLCGYKGLLKGHLEDQLKSWGGLWEPMAERKNMWASRRWEKPSMAVPL